MGFQPMRLKGILHLINGYVQVKNTMTWKVMARIGWKPMPQLLMPHSE